VPEGIDYIWYFERQPGDGSTKGPRFYKWENHHTIGVGYGRGRKKDFLFGWEGYDRFAFRAGDVIDLHLYLTDSEWGGDDYDDYIYRYSHTHTPNSVKFDKSIRSMLP